MAHNDQLNQQYIRTALFFYSWIKALQLLLNITFVNGRMMLIKLTFGFKLKSQMIIFQTISLTNTRRSKKCYAIIFDLLRFTFLQDQNVCFSWPVGGVIGAHRGRHCQHHRRARQDTTDPLVWARRQEVHPASHLQTVCRGPQQDMSFGAISVRWSSTSIWKWGTFSGLFPDYPASQTTSDLLICVRLVSSHIGVSA